MKPTELYHELKRRRVFRVAVVYAVVAWVLVQVTATVFPHLALPDWTITFVIVLAIVAFPIAIVLAWAFDLTPEGVKRTGPAEGAATDAEDDADSASAHGAAAGPATDTAGARAAAGPATDTAGARAATGTSSEPAGARAAAGTSSDTAGASAATGPATASATGATAGGAGAPGSRTPRIAFYGGIALAVGAGLLFAYFRPAGEPAPLPDAAVNGVAPDPSIAVLPFLNMSPDEEQEYFSDGITEDLITNLSRIDGLRVISRTSVMRYKGTELSVPEIAGQLGVGYILEGSVRREGDEVRITAQLLDAAHDDHVWADRYDRRLTGVFEVQSEIADRIAAALAQRLSPTQRERIAEGGTESPVAYDLLLRGREYLNRPGAADVRKYPPALAFFRRALDADPDYARAYASIAEAFRRNPAPPIVPVRRDSVLYYATRAAELDPRSQEAATELGWGRVFAGDYDRAEVEFRRALELNPNQADAMEGLARISVLNDRLDEAVRWQRRAVAVDPFAAARVYMLGYYLFDLGDLEGAEENFRGAIALAPDFASANYLLALVHLVRGEVERADRRMQALLETAGDNPAAHFTMIQYLLDRGRLADAAALVERFTEASPLGDSPAGLMFRAIIAFRLGDDERAAELRRVPEELFESWEAEGLTVPPQAQLQFHFFRGDRDAALGTLREHWRSALRSIEDPPFVGVYYIDHNPLLVDLRDDPEFQALLAQMRAELDSLRAVLRAEAAR